MTDVQSLKKGALVAATYDTILQVGLRIMSFILNAFIIRHVSHEVFAVMTVRLHLLYATGLLLSREAFRRAALSSKGSGQIYRLINLIWIGWVVSIPVGCLGWCVWSYVMIHPPHAVAPYYETTVLFIVSSIVVEVAAEVPYILGELQMWTKTRVTIEGMMQTLRSLLLATFVFKWPSQAVLLYGISHLCGSVMYTASYYGFFAYVMHRKKEVEKLPVKSLGQLFPSWEQGIWLPSVDTELGRLAWSFFRQGWLKEALTEGEFYLMNFFQLISLAQQGVYQVVNNLGSLAARLVFRSVEAAAYKFFAQMMERGKSVAEQDQKCIAESVKFLSSLLHNLVLVSLIIITFGWSYSRVVLQLYGGAQLSEGGGTPLMRAQCFYVIFLAVNGITEAYTFASMDDSQLSRFNGFLVFFSVIYIISAVVLTQIFGALGFILANCLNMSLRIAYSLRFIYKQYQESCHRPLKSLLVRPKLLCVFLTAWILTSASEGTVYHKTAVGHISIGALALLAVVYALRWELRPLLEKVLDLTTRFISRFFPRKQHHSIEVKLGDSIRKVLYKL
ncbi:protein RFT1 homolog isoform X1 [Eriocheir sinensis]|uniref:protein RFT1 homolog isoform X1 n=1 Tax=Eriocheir sinensis TaxID=95602 RepID=UPI0021CA31B1|nr:protein RFT1 homolog isoform X1 [Eriocheir sinensis]XP_050687420.1 protein RFT1 homolog isoform X1 [Eriocheir sinensis]XP_050687421.1 protein RFT1 homolog isoform X1 [Eriocheir sinensis]